MLYDTVQITPLRYSRILCVVVSCIIHPVVGVCLDPLEKFVVTNMFKILKPLLGHSSGKTDRGAVFLLLVLWGAHGAADAGRQAATVRCPFLNPELDFGIQVANSAGRYLDPRGKHPGPFKPPSRRPRRAGHFSRFSAAEDALRVFW